MGKLLLPFRLEQEKLTGLKELAKIRGVRYTDLLREKVDELLNFEVYDEKTIQIVNKLLQELNRPFAYIKTAKWQEIKKQEIKSRKIITDRIKQAFNMGVA